MAVLSHLHFGILLIAHAALGIPWSAKPAARYEGYDLERGPVLYEAYYPEEQNVEKESPNMYQEKRYFDHLSVPERSYQISADPYEIPYEPEVTEVREEYIRPNSGYAAFTANRPQTVQKKDYIGQGQQSQEYIFANPPLNVHLNQDHLESGIANDYSFVRSQSNAYDDQNKKESAFVEPGQMNYGDQDVQRIVPINDEFIFGEPPLINKAPNFEGSFINLNQKEIFGGQNFVNDYSRQKETPRLPMENIFEPRPQTINYVFSAPKKAENLKSVEFEPETEDNDWPRNYGDNIIQAEIRKADEQELKNQEAKIASIEVSQVPHHKIRHHHGERPKRKYP